MKAILLSLSMLVVAACGIFGLLYDPGHPWMDRPRKIGVAILCVAGAVALATIISAAI